MTKEDQSKHIKDFILNKIGAGEKNPVKITSEHFGISRQAVNRYLKKLTEEGLIGAGGTTRNREYHIKELLNKISKYDITVPLAEDKVWREDIKPFLNDLPKSVMDICEYGFTEILNNAIEHSEGTEARVNLFIDILKIRFVIIDNGVGIFNKIRTKFNLDDELHAILELSKGKLTTDPARHSGEGIFFTSRVFDEFSIFSGNLFFNHDAQSGDWLLDSKKNFNGTHIEMLINRSSKQTLKAIFDQFASKNNYGFTKTKVPVILSKYGDENLISRSQARRLLFRFNCFKEIILDFNKVNMIGQAFADEIFRVFQNNNPEINIWWVNANKDVENMILRAKSNTNTTFL